VADEAKERGYHFDISKIAMPRGTVTIPVAKGQLAYELTHLKQKLRQRDAERLQLVSGRGPVKVNSTFKAVGGANSTLGTDTQGPCTDAYQRESHSSRSK
jgi:hypothetical protein